MGLLFLLPLPPLLSLPLRGAEFVRRALSFREDLLGFEEEDEMLAIGDLVVLRVAVAWLDVSRFSGESGGVS